MHCDGDFVIYRIQGREANRDERGWFNASLDHFGTPPGFGASAPCWQKTGIHGTFDKKEGLRALALFNEYHIEYDWRLMEMTISQHHREIASMVAQAPGKKRLNWNSYPTKEDEELLRRARAIRAGGEPSS